MKNNSRNQIKFFRRRNGPDGVPCKTGIVIVCWRGWSLDWKPRCKYTRLGLYTNLRVRGGLVAALNLPVFGDISLWR